MRINGSLDLQKGLLLVSSLKENMGYIRLGLKLYVFKAITEGVKLEFIFVVFELKKNKTWKDSIRFDSTAIHTVPSSFTKYTAFQEGHLS